jgi:hypothetical protein
LGREGFKNQNPPREREREKEKGEPKEGARQRGEETRRRTRGAALVLPCGSEEAAVPAEDDRFPDDC